MTDKKFFIYVPNLGVIECSVIKEKNKKVTINSSFFSHVDVDKQVLSTTVDDAKIRYYKKTLSGTRDKIKRLKRELKETESDYNKYLEELGIKELLKRFPEKFLSTK